MTDRPDVVRPADGGLLHDVTAARLYADLVRERYGRDGRSWFTRKPEPRTPADTPEACAARLRALTR